MATIYEVSKLAGVSLATVSRVINAPDKVSPKTRKKVLTAIAKLGYRPNSMAQSLASRRSNKVGILIPELHGPFFGTLLSSIEAELRESKKRVTITAGHSTEAEEKDCIEFLMGSSCDALILHVFSVSDEYLLELNSGPVPIFLLNRYIPEMADRCISVDDEHGGYLATKYLLEIGHTQIAYISGPVWKSDARKRLKGHIRALTEFGLEMNTELLREGDFEEASGREAMTELLECGETFTALVCANDEMAAGAFAVVRQKNMRIPDDLSIVGYDDVPFARFLYPRLSTIGCQTIELGQMLARCVLKNVYGREDLITKHLFKPKLIQRESARPV